MKYGLENNYIKIELNDYGAELQSIVKDGKEYLWVADEKYWNEHSPILFPFVGRLTEGKYQLILNSDDTKFGGSGSIRKKVFHANKSECDGREYSIEYPLPAYGVAVFRF